MTGGDTKALGQLDTCNGHAGRADDYHYHAAPVCMMADQQSHYWDTHPIGWALDGFPITGPKVGIDNILTTSDLDECHGITSTITVDGARVTMYHYVMTQDFPYSLSCFRGDPIDAPH